LFFKRTQNKKFDHIPRFYKPEVDEGERRKRRLKFRISSGSRKKSRIPIALILLFAVIIYFIIKLNTM